MRAGGQAVGPWRVPQMSTARRRNEGRTQSGGVEGLIVSDPTGTISRRARVLFSLT